MCSTDVGRGGEGEEAVLTQAEPSTEVERRSWDVDGLVGGGWVWPAWVDGGEVVSS